MHTSIEIRKLSKQLGSLQVLRGVDLLLSTEPCVWLGLIGANGSGKSTLLRVLAGEYTADGGDVLHQGLSATPAQLRQIVGYCLSPDRLPTDLTGEQVLRLLAAAKCANESWLDCLDQEAKTLFVALDLAAVLPRPVRFCSLGMKQKLCLAGALLGDPKVVILDEALDALDPRAAGLAKRFLRAAVDQGRFSIIMAAHALEQIERWCDSAVLLQQGRIQRIWDHTALQQARAGEGLEAEVLALLADQ